MSIHAAGVLAGAYRGQKLEERRLLRHAVSDVPLILGRLKRKPGQALCDVKLVAETSLVDEGGWLEAEQVSCPGCLDVILRWNLA